MSHKIIIIGAGASGITAAITAKDLNTDVALLEGNDRIGKKILTTGNGRCNIDNKYISPDRYHSENPVFFEHILKNFSPDNAIEFFSSLGLPLVTLEEGKMFPMSLQASSVLDILKFSIEERNIPVYFDSKVKEIKKTTKGFSIYTHSGKEFTCSKLILAAGGKSAPKTGSDGSGLRIAKSLGHNIINTIPALVQLKLDYNHLKALSGIKINGTVEIFVNNKSMRKETGEILFTDYGISGPPILQISRIASEALFRKSSVSIHIDMMKNMENEILDNFFQSHWSIFWNRSVHDSLVGIINKKLIPIFLKECGLESIHIPCSNLSFLEKKKILSLLKLWEFKVSGTNSFNDSQVTSGGVDTREVNPETLESKLIPGLYFAGEILDVDGDCGGFNLHWAWASGYTSGKHASL